MPEITIVVKPAAGGEKVPVSANTSLTVQELKEEVAKGSGVPASEQRLIYKGQILRDERTIESYSVGDEHVVHMVRRHPQGTGASAPGSQDTPANPPSNSPPLGTLFGVGGASTPSGQQFGEMFNSPFVQSLLSNPEFLQNLLRSNPAIREIIDRNPELAHVLNNPDVLREYFQLASNPNLMQEHIRNADRALSNLESLPEGFNTLRRIYESVQEPLMNATTASTDSAANPFSALFPNPSTATTTAGTDNSTPGSEGGVPNTAPLPNPWAPPPAAGGPGGGPGVPPTSTGATGTETRGDTGGTGGGAFPLPGGLPFGLGGLGSGGAPNMNSMMQAMQDPAFQQMVQSMISTPGMVDSLFNAVPGLRQAAEANPQLRETLSNPEMLRTVFDPQNLQAMMQMQQAMQQLQSSGLGSMMGLGDATGTGANPTGGGNPLGGANTAAGLASLLAGGLGGPPPVADPETAYATQLQQLQDMGFSDRQANIRALQATGGNVNAAVERLLSGF